MAGHAPPTSGPGAGGDWLPVDGPVTRWARRAIAGEHVLLLLDELPRGHKSCTAAIMRVLNVYDRRTVAAQGLPVPADAAAGDGFHIIDVWMTRERLVVPAARVKIIATGNLGEGYEGLDLTDPAFRRRWGGWLHLASYPPEIQAQILGDRLDLPPSGRLIAAMRAVAKGVEQYQRDEERLLTTLDLATLITWGGAVIHAVERRGRPVSAAFVDAALDVWLERVCPTKDAELAPDVVAQLLRVLREAAPSALR